MSGEPGTAALAIALAEEVDDRVDGLGATLVITPTRAVIVRQRAEVRPRSGIRAWPYDELSDVQLVPPRHGNGRVILRTGVETWRAVSVFVDAADWPAAERVVGMIRTRILRARRARSSERPDVTEVGPPLDRA